MDGNIKLDLPARIRSYVGKVVEMEIWSRRVVMEVLPLTDNFLRRKEEEDHKFVFVGDYAAPILNQEERIREAKDKNALFLDIMSEVKESGEESLVRLSILTPVVTYSSHSTEEGDNK